MSPSNDLAKVVAKLLELTGTRPRVVVAFSGGVDSTVLAHVLAKSRRKFASLRWVHIDHGLQPASGEWARRCARQARRWRIPVAVLSLSIEVRRGESPEAAARQARYAALAGVLEPGEVLVTAQHRDDQVETLLLQLFRGAGVAGLAAMPAFAPFAAGYIARPLLDVSRAELESYARQYDLRWIEDPTNALVRFDRNYLRHRVLPRIRARWKGLDQAVARSARHMAEAARLLDETARRDLAAAADGNALSVVALRTLPAPRRRNALRAFITAAGVEVPSASKLGEISTALLSARADAQPHVEWPEGRIRRDGGRLTLEVISRNARRSSSAIALKSWLWERDRECLINEAGDFLAIVADEFGPIDLERFPASLELRARKGGESLRPGPRARTQSLKKLMQAADLSIDERARLPLLYAGERLVAVGDRWIDASIAANDKSRRRARLAWTRAP
jgi:tRNA(Ile)-lysidine synthase